MKKFEKSDVFFNVIRANPKASFFTYDGKVYHANSTEQSIQLNNLIHELPPLPPPEVTIENLVVNLDAIDASSYPGFGTDWFDLTDNNHDMQLENSPTYESTIGYFEFDNTATPPIKAANSNVSTPGVNDFTIADNYTIEAWFYSYSTQTGARSIIEKRYTAAGAPLSLRYPYSLVHDKTTNEFIFSVGNGSTTINSSIVSVVNEWVQCVGVYDWVNDQLKFYKNGILEDTVDISSMTGVINNTISLTMARRGEFDQPWAGRFAILRIYDKALDSSEVNGNFEATKNRFGL